MTAESLRSLRIESSSPSTASPRNATPLRISPPPTYLGSLAEGMAPLRDIPTLVLGVQSDILFPVEQQREVVDALRMAGNESVVYYELGGVWGHDTFL